MNQPESAALICRVSSREQEEGYSLDAQEHFLEEACEKRGFAVSLVHRFSETASKHNERKKFMVFMKEVTRLKIQHILVEKVDRLIRGGLKESVMIDDWLEEDEHRHIHCVKDGIDLHKYSRSGEKLNWGIRAVMAKNYTDNLREEVMKTADEMLRRGIWPTKTPVGYVRDKAQPVSPIQPNPAQVALVQEMFKLYDSGDWSVERLSFKMEELGLLSANNRRIMPSRVHRLLQNPFYIGKMRFRGTIWQGAHDPIVGIDLFERVQARLKRKHNGSGAVLYHKHLHILAGLTICDTCTRRVSWEVQKQATYGYCKHYEICTLRANTKEAAVETALLPYLEALKVLKPRAADWVYRALRAKSAAAASLKQNRQAQLEEELRFISQKTNRILDMRIEGELTKEEFESKRTTYLHEKGRIEEQLKSLDGASANGSADAAEIYAAAQEAATRYGHLEPAEKRKLLLKLFAVVKISGSSVSAEYMWIYKLLAKAVAETNSSKIPETVLSGEANFELVRVGSGKKKDPLSQAGPSSWLAAWEEFRTSVYIKNSSIAGNEI